MIKNYSKKKVVIFGDSNTYGYRGYDGGRYNSDERWVDIAERTAGDHYQIINCGMNGRIAYNYMPPCIEADYVCVMLGSNDLLCGFGFGASELAQLAYRVIEQARNLMDETYPDNNCKYVLISPPCITEDILNGPWQTAYEGPETIEISRCFADAYEAVAREKNILFFDAAPYGQTCKEDGIHLTVMGHRLLGEAFGRFLLTL